MKNSVDSKKFATHFRKIRESHNLSQQQIADMANVSKITIQRIENAKSSVTVDLLISVARALNIPLSDFVNFELEK